MTRILVILDGAPEPLRPWPTTLERADTPVLDRLCAAGEVGRLRTTPDGCPPGSETGLPVLLGARVDEPVGRGPLEAAAAGVEVAEGMGAWRLDLRHPDGRRVSDREARRLWPLLRRRLPRHRIRPLRGHRLLAVGAQPPVLRRCAGLDVTVWPDGARLRPVLARPTTMVCGPGAASGIGRLLGARVETPEWATGDADTDLDAKAAYALRALERGDDVVVHVGGADETAHRRERDAKRSVLEAADARLIGPLATAARASGATLAVTSDHGTCPWTGHHHAAPVPYVAAGPGIAARGPMRLSERAVRHAAVLDAPWPIVREALA